MNQSESTETTREGYRQGLDTASDRGHRGPVGINDRQWLQQRALAYGVRSTATEFGLTRKLLADVCAGFPVDFKTHRRVHVLRQRILNRSA